jgi:hypothetical protein
VAVRLLVAVAGVVLVMGGTTLGESSGTARPAATRGSTGTPGVSGATGSLRLVEPAPGDVVARVGSRSITRKLYEHWLAVARKSSPHGSPPKLRRQALTFLISGDWIEGEANERGITASQGEVRKRVRRMKREQFHSERAFRRFLRKSGLTVSDFLFRVRLDVLADRIHAQVVMGKSGPARKRALDEFSAASRAKWKDRTYCLPAFTTEQCGHGL